MAQRITIAGLLKLELPGHTARLVDGGTLVVDGETYLSIDSLLGTLDALESMTEGVGDEAPAATLGFLPPDDADPAVLNNPDMQGARVRAWTTEVDADTGLTIGAPEQHADWIIDFPTLTLGIEKRRSELACVSSGDRFFQINRGNCLSPTFHRAIHPGEAGLDNASAAETNVPWGAPSPSRGTSMGTGGGYYSGRPPTFAPNGN